MNRINEPINNASFSFSDSSLFTIAMNINEAGSAQKPTEEIPVPKILTELVLLSNSIFSKLYL